MRWVNSMSYWALIEENIINGMGDKMGVEDGGENWGESDESRNLFDK